MRKGFWRTSLVLALSVTTALAYGGAGAFAETSSDVQSKIDHVNQKQQQNQGSINQSKQKLSQNKDKQSAMIDQIKAAEQKISDLNVKINDTQSQVTATQSEIDQLNKQIDVINKRIAARDKILKARVKSMYINGGAIDPMTVLLGSKTFGDFLDRVLALGMIAKQDRALLLAQKKDMVDADKKKSQVESKMQQIQKDLADLKGMKSELDKEKASKQELLKKLQASAQEINKEIMNKNETASILADQKAALKKEKDKVIAQAAAAKAAAEKAAAAKAAAEKAAAEKAAAAKAASARSSAPSSPAPSSPAPSITAPVTSPAPQSHAMFIMPAAGYISQPYGPRKPPETGFHPGIDIANNTGTPIHAAADGIVFRAYLSSSYGNCVMITHDIGGTVYTTVYAHMEHFVVTGGQSVSQGQVIGYMGSTGDSTGPHLHFEMYIGPWTPPPHNGTVNPLNYIH